MPGNTHVIDLRGMREPAPAPSVLADPTGRRARRLRVSGRIAGSLLLLWLCGLVLAGLGLVPVSDVPLAGTFRPAEEPTQLSKIPNPLAPSRDDLRPARSLPALAHALARPASDAGHGSGAHGAARGPNAASPRSSAGARRAPHREAAASRHPGTSGGTASHGTPSTPVGTSHASPAAGPSATSPSTAAHGSAGGTVTPPASSSGTVHGQSGQPHGSSSSAPGHTRVTTSHGPPAG